MYKFGHVFSLFLCFISKQIFVEMFSEVITVFSQFRGNILTNLLWSFNLYLGAKMFLILITPH